ncbi:hypothetical protein [Micromonospora chokoriensis]|uniref:hypothetical protein n=1 Tax=Micromonospora chokoriensis TaxID=356851 RepID=UPI0012FAAF03|nr:hypothetical protein [Micromonospora chokoriensis]
MRKPDQMFINPHYLADHGVVVGDKVPVQHQSRHHNSMIDEAEPRLLRDLAIAVAA